MKKLKVKKLKSKKSKVVVTEMAKKPPPIRTPEIRPAYQFTSWSPSRLDDYQTCPYMASLKHLRKLCTSCYQGSLRGGYNSPAKCDRCGYVQVKAPPLVRGAEIGDRQDAYIAGKAVGIHPEITHPVVRRITEDARRAFKEGRAFVQLGIQVDRRWNVIRGSGYDPNTWARFKLDYLEFLTPSIVRVVDWKTGGVDKATGAIRASEKYDDQLISYSTATLLAYPQVRETEAELVFLDCGDRHDPVVRREEGALSRGMLEGALGYWATKLKPMMRDVEFAPRPNPTCVYCLYSRSKFGKPDTASSPTPHGPCKF